MKFAFLMTILMSILVFSTNAEARVHEGTWKSSGDIHFVAHIKNDQIEMNLVTPDMGGLYWKGTWPKSHNNIFVSKADWSALSNAVFGSENATKSFSYRNRTLCFFFTMQGTSKWITLKRA
jgi:hypothetical protein